MAQQPGRNDRVSVTIRRLFVGIVALLAFGTACTPEQVIATAAGHGITLTHSQAEAAIEAYTARLAATPPVKINQSLNWAALRKCEAGGNYKAVSKTGKYRGAYQFDQRTWNGVARSIAPGYVNVKPDAAPPHIQDAAAQALYNARGRAPWPVCGRRL